MAHAALERRLELCITGVGLATLSVPLVIAPESFIYPFIVPKVLLLRSLVVLMAAFYAALLFANEARYRPKATPLHLAILAYFVSIAISTVTGVDWYRSLWDTHERMLGTFTMLHYGALFLVLSRGVRTDRQWSALFWGLLAVGVAIAIVGAIQRFDDPRFLFNGGSRRVKSTLGNPIYVSGYGLFMVFSGLLVQSWYRSVHVKALAMLGVLFGVANILFAESRGTYAGTAVFALVAILSYFLPRLLKDRRGRIIALVLVLLSASLVGGAAWALFSGKAAPYLKGVPFLSRLANFANLDNPTTGGRFEAWKIAVRTWQERPVFGWGPNNFYYAFNQAYHPKYLRYGIPSTWFDNAHNVVVNTLNVQGLVGLLTYLGVYLAAAFVLWRGYRRGQVPLATTALCTAFLAGHFVYNNGVFENPTSYLYFFVFLAFVARSTTPDEVDRSGLSRVSATTGVVIAAAALGFLWIGDIRPAQANMRALDAIKALHALDGSADESKAVAVFQRSLELASPHVDGARAMFAETVSRVLPRYLKPGEDLAKQKAQVVRTIQTWQKRLAKEKDPQKKALLQAQIAQVRQRLATQERQAANLRKQAHVLARVAFDELTKNATLHPLDVRAELGRTRLAYQMAVRLGDGGPLLAALPDLKQALQHSPRRQEIHFTLADVYLILSVLQRTQAARSPAPLRAKVEAEADRFADLAIEHLQTAVELDPSIDDCHWRLARGYEGLGRFEEAKRAARRALDEHGIKFTGLAKKEIERILARPSPKGPQPSVPRPDAPDAEGTATSGPTTGTTP